MKQAVSHVMSSVVCDGCNRQKISVKMQLPMLFVFLRTQVACGCNFKWVSFCNCSTFQGCSFVALSKGLHEFKGFHFVKLILLRCTCCRILQLLWLHFCVSSLEIGVLVEYTFCTVNEENKSDWQLLVGREDRI